LAYALRGEAPAIMWIRADGAGQPVKLLEHRNLPTPYSFTPNGDRLAYFLSTSGTQGDVYTLPLDLADPERPKPGKEEVFVATNAAENEPTFSPDGRWVASNEGGDVYVRPFQPGGTVAAKWQISSSGGRSARWSRTTKQLFYETQGPKAIMVVDYSVSGDTFLAGKPRLWSAGPIFVPGGGDHIALHPDGKRFAVFVNPRTIEGKSSLSLTFLLNFFGELRRRAPAEE
jgi:serine/threonine-protein kinase